jgi:hypothetical protein
MNDQPIIRKTTIALRPAYEPDEEQIARAAARRRFNWLYIYMPVLMLTAVILILTGFMIWRVFAPTDAVNAALLSGLADVILILALLPTILIWGAIVALPIGFYIYRYQQQREEPAEDQVYIHKYGRFRVLLWRVDHKLGEGQQLLNERILPALARPIIRLHALVTAVKAWLQQWYEALTMSVTRNW